MSVPFSQNAKSKPEEQPLHPCRNARESSSAEPRNSIENGFVWDEKNNDSDRIRSRYHRRSGNSSPYIELRVDRIVLGLNGFPIRIPMLRDIIFGHVLFHDIGHHIHRTVRPEYDEKEDVADKWAGKLNGNFIRKKYWYLLPILTPALKVYKFMRRKQWDGSGVRGFLV
jgi:hypothetical protein